MTPPDPAEVQAALDYDPDASLDKLPPRPTCDCWEARSWRRYWQPEWVASRERMADWDHEQRIRQASYDVSDAMFPRPARPGSEAARVGEVLAELAPEGWEAAS